MDVLRAHDLPQHPQMAQTIASLSNQPYRDRLIAADNAVAMIGALIHETRRSRGDRAAETMRLHVEQRIARISRTGA